MYMTILIIALPILAAILALVFVFSSRGKNLSESRKKINMKMNELAEELEKKKGRMTENR